MKYLNIHIVKGPLIHKFELSLYMDTNVIPPYLTLYILYLLHILLHFIFKKLCSIPEQYMYVYLYSVSMRGHCNPIVCAYVLWKAGFIFTYLGFVCIQQVMLLNTSCQYYRPDINILRIICTHACYMNGTSV